MDNTKVLGEEKIIKLLFGFSLPGIIGLLVMASHNIIDRVFIGNGTGMLGIAVVAIVFPIMMTIMACSTLIGAGASSLISIRLGEKNTEEAELIVGNSLTLLIALSAIITIPGLIFLDPILRAFGASNEVLPYARDYSIIILIASIFMLVGSGISNVIRAEGNPRKSMITLVVGSILNIILTPTFIFAFKWGIKGAAFSTAISQFVSAVLVFSHFFSDKSVLKIRVKNMMLNRKIVWKILSIGISPFITQILSSTIYVLLNNRLAKYSGDVAISGMGIVSTVQTFVMLPLWGISNGIQPIVGFNYGARKLDRVREVLKAAVIFATAIASIAFVLTRLFPEQLVALFNSQDRELIEFGRKAILTYLIFTPLFGIQIIGAGYFQSIGKPKQAMFLSLTRQGIIIIPALLILPMFFQLQGVLISGPVSDFVSTAVVGAVLVLSLKGTKTEKNKEEQAGSETVAEVVPDNSILDAEGQ